MERWKQSKVETALDEMVVMVSGFIDRIGNRVVLLSVVNQYCDSLDHCGSALFRLVVQVVVSCTTNTMIELQTLPVVPLSVV